jgi:undecaprenyl-phosphate galactose phosphotransferase
VPSLRRLPLFGLSTSYFFGKDLLLLQVRNNLARLPQRFLKRSMDLFGATAAVLLLWPLFLVFAALIKLEDGGLVFFVQERVGRHGRDLPGLPIFNLSRENLQKRVSTVRTRRGRSKRD